MNDFICMVYCNITIGNTRIYLLILNISKIFLNRSLIYCVGNDDHKRSQERMYIILFIRTNRNEIP